MLNKPLLEIQLNTLWIINAFVFLSCTFYLPVTESTKKDTFDLFM